MKQFGIITNLVGGFSMSSLGFVMPPLLYMIFYWPSLSLKSKVFHITLTSVGTLAVLSTTTLTLLSLFKDSDDNRC